MSGSGEESAITLVAKGLHSSPVDSKWTLLDYGRGCRHSTFGTHVDQGFAAASSLEVVCQLRHLPDARSSDTLPDEAASSGASFVQRVGRIGGVVHGSRQSKEWWHLVELHADAAAPDIPHMSVDLCGLGLYLQLNLAGDCLRLPGRSSHCRVEHVHRLAHRLRATVLLCAIAPVLLTRWTTAAATRLGWAAAGSRGACGKHGPAQA